MGVCTIVLASRVWPELPLVVACNRDEALGRPADPPTVRALGARWILAPRDRIAEGTWLGLNDQGVFVGLTNRYDPAARGEGRRPGSRGQVVLDALAQPTAAAAADRAATVDPTQQGGFHLLMADRAAAYLVWSDTRRVHRATLAPGIFVVTERSFDAAATDREPRLVRSLAGVADGPVPTLAQWRGWLSQHDEAPLEGVCVHAPARGYGTRSSCVVRLAADGGAEVAHAEGPPCTTPYVDQATLVAQLASHGDCGPH